VSPTVNSASLAIQPFAPKSKKKKKKQGIK
jgi:hypothetical protein